MKNQLCEILYWFLINLEITLSKLVTMSYIVYNYWGTERYNLKRLAEPQKRYANARKRDLFNSELTANNALYGHTKL